MVGMLGGFCSCVLAPIPPPKIEPLNKLGAVPVFKAYGKDEKVTVVNRCLSPVDVLLQAETKQLPWGADFKESEGRLFASSKGLLPLDEAQVTLAGVHSVRFFVNRCPPNMDNTPENAIPEPD
jgi:hypothetical protein